MIAHQGVIGIAEYGDGYVHVLEGKKGAEDTWNLPGVSIEDEPEKEAVTREFREETGMNVLPRKKLGVYRYEDDVNGSPIQTHVWICEVLDGDFSP